MMHKKVVAAVVLGATGTEALRLRTTNNGNNNNGRVVRDMADNVVSLENHGDDQIPQTH